MTIFSLRLLIYLFVCLFVVLEGGHRQLGQGRGRGDHHGSAARSTCPEADHLRHGSQHEGKSVLSLID